MAETTIQGYIDGYLAFLKDHSREVAVSENISKITLPFLDSLNDCTEIFIVKNGNDFIVTDNGETLSNLSFNGITIKGAARQNIFNRIVHSYGVQIESNSMFIKATMSDLYLKKHLLLQCISKVNDMYMLSRNNVQSIFLEEIRGFFDDNDVGYVPDHRITGRSGLTANYDFAIPRSKATPFTLIKAVNNLNKDKVKSTIFDWNDTMTSCEDRSRLFVVYNDLESSPKDDAVSALQTYGVSAHAWSKKDTILSALRSA